MMIIKIKL